VSHLAQYVFRSVRFLVFETRARPSLRWIALPFLLATACSDPTPLTGVATVDVVRRLGPSGMPAKEVYTGGGWTCDETLWLSDGSSMITCYFGGGGGGPTSYPEPPASSPAPPPPTGGGLSVWDYSGVTNVPANDGTQWYDIAYDQPCGSAWCNHVVGLYNPHFLNCPTKIFYSNWNGEHGAEVWQMTRRAKLYDPVAGTEVGFYTGTSVIGGFTWYASYARITCDAAYGILSGVHPGYTPVS
jgi:hypothetical protein